MRRTFLLLALIAVWFCVWNASVAVANPTESQGPLTWREIPPRPGSDYVLPNPGRRDVQMEVLVDGRPLRVVHHAGRDYLVVPRHGFPYVIRIRNNGPRRITAIVSVDGLSVITRQPASVRDPGYLVERGGEIVIKGFRLSRGTVAEFRFENADRSYAAKIGRKENVGVIGLVAIEEWVPSRWPQEERLGRAIQTGKADVGSTGTAAGPDVHSPSYEVPFIRGKVQTRMTLYYDTEEALRRAGVPVTPRWPMPFPGDD